VSSLRDDLNSRAYAREGRSGVRTCHCSGCDATPVVPCRVCGEDEIPLDEDGHCATCAPTEFESCEDWVARVREIRRTKP
jgi:hypothetical protein